MRDNRPAVGTVDCGCGLWARLWEGGGARKREKRKVREQENRKNEGNEREWYFPSTLFFHVPSLLSTRC
jgi:hypothetical protein